MKKNKKTKGFTLIEAIVTIAIITLLFSLSIPNFRSYRNHIAVRNSAKEMQSILWEAQALSLSPRSSKTTSYFVNVQTCSIPACTPFPIMSDPSEIAEGFSPLKSFSLDERIYVSEILFYKNTIITSVPSVALSFAVGNKTGGSITINDPNKVVGEKAEIILSSLDTKVRYKITISSGTNIIGMDLIPAQ